MQDNKTPLAEETFTKSEKLIIPKNKVVRLSRVVRLMIFIFFWFIMLFNCSDGGVPSASSVYLKKDLNFTDYQFGKYGSIVQLGRITGTLINMILMSLFNRKYLMIFAVFLKCSTFLIYLVTSNFWIIILFRYLQGVSHVFPYVYFTAWCKQFGMQKYSVRMVSAMQTASPFGSVFGFSETTYIGPQNWRWGFALLAFLIIPFNIALLFVPDEYFSGQVFYLTDSDKVTKEVIEPLQERGKLSVFSVFEEKDSKKEEAKKKNIWLSLLDPLFLLVCISRTVLMFIFMAIHFWLGDYYENVLKLSKAEKVSSYSFISLVGPFTGAFIAGFVSDYFGGFKNKVAYLLCIFFSFLTCLCAVVVPEVTNKYIFFAALFGFFLFANCMMPILIGLAFESAPKEYGTTAYSINSLLCTFLGNFPSTSVYGYINGKFKETDNRMAMRCVINYIWVNLGLLCICAFIRFNRGEKGEKKNSDDQEAFGGQQMENK